MRIPILALFFLLTPAESGSSTTVERTATDLNYSVEAYECDGELRKMDDKYKKEMGGVYRVCFEPNYAAKQAGANIEKVDFWRWNTHYNGGEAFQTAVEDGEAQGGITHFECVDGGKLCFLDTFLTAEFYKNSGTVLGKGTASFTSATGTVPVEFDLFMHKFKMKLDDQLKEYLESMKEKGETPDLRYEYVEEMDEL